MRTITLVSRDPGVTARLRRVLNGGLEIVPVDSVRDAVDPGRPSLADVLVVDLGSTRVDPTELGALQARATRPVVVGLVSEDEPEATGAERCDLVVSSGLPDGALRMAIEQAIRVRRLELEVDHLRRERVRVQAGGTTVPAPGGAATAPASLWTVLREMGKLVAAHFDLERVIDFFLDAITELVRPARTALLLVDEDRRYRVRGQRGLDPHFVATLRLEPDEGLAAWFRREGRLAVRQELVRETEWLDAVRELQALGGEVAVPLWVQAKLVGILTLGPRVTGQPYGSEDLERLFTLTGQVAMAVEDIALFSTVRAQHSFIEQVLAHLQNGAITIDAGGRVTRVNRRAEELLGLQRADVLGRDLRALPSPLGDLLFAALRGERELRLEEVPLPRRATPLEVSTSQIAGPGGAPAGAVMIFDDPMPRHLLHRERQTSQTLDLLNRVLLRLTDEIKNPLVSIYTFLELLPQRYDDPEFRETFLTVVGKDTQRLISLVDKLIILAGEREYKIDFCDLRELLNDTLADVSLRFERTPGSAEGTLFLLRTPERRDHLTAVLSTPETDLTVKADRDQLGKALGYLFRFLLNRVAADGRVIIHVVADPDRANAIRLSIIGRPATLTPLERERLFSPLAIASDRLLDVGPSVSQKIVEGHGGSLVLGGQEGEIRFVLTLPRTPQ
jgi:PAS domain S-box-containing protein